MGFWDFLTKRQDAIKIDLKPLRKTRARLTVNDTQSSRRGVMRWVQPPETAGSTWRVYDLDAQELAQLTPTRLIEILADASPEVSRALFDFVRLFNPGWEVMTYRPGSEEQDTRAQALVDEFFQALKDRHGAADVVLNRLILGAFLRGAFFSELVMDRSGRLPLDIATPDPAAARFERMIDPDYGEVWVLGQWIDGEFMRLDEFETVSYIPIDPFPNQPYGRSPVLPALFTAVFLLGILHDLKRVIEQQGYPRIVVRVSLEKLAEIAPDTAQPGTEEFNQWVDATINEVKSVYASLQPDDAYITTDEVEIDNPIGTVDADSLGAIDKIIVALERMLIRALKTVPLLFGVNETSSETHANRQWEVHAAGIASLQHLLEAQLEKLLGLALQAQGVAARVEFRFSQLRASEALRDAQSEAMEISNATAKYEAGWISQDEASEMITGSPADVPEPRRGGQPVVEMVESDGDGEAADSEERTLNGYFTSVSIGH